MRGTQKTRKTGHYTIEERLGDSVFLETAQVAATRKDSFAQRVCFRCVTHCREINRSIFGRQAPV